MNHGLVILVGVGRGFGIALAESFGKVGYDIVLMGRDFIKLEKESLSILERIPNIKIYTVCIDVTDSDSVNKAFGEVKRLKLPVACLIYNAVARRSMKPSELTTAEVMKDLEVNLGGAVSCTHQVLRLFKEQASGTIIFTGGGVAITPSLIASSMSVGKAALRNYAINLHNELRDSNVFVGTVTITQPVQEGTKYSPDFIAEQFFKMFSERKNAEMIV